MKIKGQAHKERPEDQYGEYFRVISELDVGKTDECIAYLKEIVVDKCLCSSPVSVRKKQTQFVLPELQAVLAAMATWPNVRIEA